MSNFLASEALPGQPQWNEPALDQKDSLGVGEPWGPTGSVSQQQEALHVEGLLISAGTRSRGHIGYRSHAHRKIRGVSNISALLPAPRYRADPYVQALPTPAEMPRRPLLSIHPVEASTPVQRPQYIEQRDLGFGDFPAVAPLVFYPSQEDEPFVSFSKPGDLLAYGQDTTYDTAGPQFQTSPAARTPDPGFSIASHTSEQAPSYAQNTHDYFLPRDPSADGISPGSAVPPPPEISALRAEMSEDERAFKCPICDRPPFRSMTDLGRHIRMVHGEGGKWRCYVPECKRQAQPFVRKDNFIKHMRDVHNIVTPERPSISSPSPS